MSAKRCLLLLAGLFSASALAATAAAEPQVRFEDATVRGKAGFFRVGRSSDGQWWLIDPDGKPFFYKGVCAINRAGTQGGRRAEPGEYAQAVDRKYDYQRSPDAFVTACIEKLKAWNFNAMGAWTTEEFFDKGFPYTEIVEFHFAGPFLPGPPDKKPNTSDIFDPEWVKNIDAKAKALCAPRRDSRQLVGYFTDNEIGFGRAGDDDLDPGFQTGGRFGVSLLRKTLALDPKFAGHKAALEFVLARHGNDLGKLARAWGVALASKADLAKLGSSGAPIPGEAYRQDAAAFSRHYAERYFRLAGEAIRRHDPNHLILGCRFGSPPEDYVLDAMKPHVDVISANNYRPSLYERYDPMYRRTGLPIIIGEFSWNTDLFKEVPLPDEPAGGLGKADRMFRRGTAVLLRAATHPGIVGYTWYRWVQPRSTGTRFTDGLVDYQDEPDIHHPHLTKVNALLDGVRIRSARARPDAEGELTGEVSLSLPGMRPGGECTLAVTVGGGKWHREAFGWLMNAQVSPGRSDDGRIRLAIKVKVSEFRSRGGRSPGGEGTYDVTLTRQGIRLTGSYEGTYNGRKVGGEASGWLFPPIPTAPPAFGPSPDRGQAEARID